MRTIKYRQPLFNPDGSFKEYHYWGIIDLVGEGIKQLVSPITAKYYIDIKITNPADSQQFTGLIDKNGKEIYEGDIVHYLLNHSDNSVTQTSEVRWHNHAWRLPRVWLFTEVYEIEVIGNIHQNPELLCQK